MGLEDSGRGSLKTITQTDDASTQRLHLLLVGPRQCATHLLPEQGSLTIGRSEKADITIDDPLISREHARCHVGDPIRIEDLGSANGTRVRGERLAPNTPVEVALGEAISLGSSLIIVERMQDTLRFRRSGVEDKTSMASFPADGKSPEPLLAPTTGQPRGGLSSASENESTVLIKDPSMVQLYSIVDRIARGSINVLILGETGVGKEVVAQAIHDRSPRAEKPYLKLNCAAFSETLLESELFGHEKGAFTGAARAKQGLLVAADGGTVFLDEVGELPMSIQAKLLRVIEAREVLPVGAQWPKSIDVRFVAATNRNLEEECRSKNFREDLYFRLNGFTLQVPPLRERTSEIAGLAGIFLRRACREAGRDLDLRITASALEWLLNYSWPGNIRELRNVIERAVLLAEADEITEAHLPIDKMSATGFAAPSRVPPSPNLAPDLSPSELAERTRIVEALESCGGNQTQAAKSLGVSRGTLVSRLDRYAIPRPRKN